MKIDSTPKVDGTTRIKETKGGQARALARRTQQDGVQDEVALTGNAAKLQELEVLLAEMELADPKRVEAIRQAIAEGSFKVDAEAVADALIKEAIELISRQGRQ
ncbi:MAG TPA: flagellar biosynthesis anti-sigma factor FlgM [Thiobacillaceae bacterium]|nr:flagellar biosynthesis anti-sigma factor FlgM [Thiobacillaceae bacterium]HNU62968.1 flagellar biosynthesis anti-sigma factor FlgM [Thiobacillaceae bacterium]